MRLWVISDLHIEHEAFRPEPPEADVAVLAGDISRPLSFTVAWAAAEIAYRMPVVLVPGNQEFYADSILVGLARGRAEAAQHRGIHLLSDNAVVIAGVRFVGGTLWTDYELGASPQPGPARDRDVAYAMKAARETSADNVKIHLRDAERERMWSPEDARAAHRRTRAYLESELAAAHAGPTVVVTHHAPAPGSVHPRFARSPVTPAYASDLSELILEGSPELWIHGHVHDSFDYRVGATRVVCNPRGFHGENPDFDPALVVEVGT